MLPNAHPSAPRRSVTTVLRTVGMALILAAVMVAPATSLTSQNDTVHPAAKTPRFVTQTTIGTPVVKTIVAKGSTALLPVVVQEDIKARHQILADGTLRALPSFCRDHLENFYVNYDKKAANRGLGGESTIIVIGTVPDSEFRALVIHECGHVTDLGGLRGTPNASASIFHDGSTPIYQNDPSVAFYQISWLTTEILQPNSKDTDFVSGYAASDPFEDFAESFAFYALQKKEFARLAQKNPVLKAKFDFMENVVFEGKTEIAQGKFVKGKRVPWDVTKLPYVWHAKK